MKEEQNFISVWNNNPENTFLVTKINNKLKPERFFEPSMKEIRIKELLKTVNGTENIILCASIKEICHILLYRL